jgi:guanylate kinase
VDYHFLSPEEFENRIAQREFLEYAQYVGNYYGTSARIVEQKLAAGIDVLLDIEVQGAEKVRKNSPESVLVFLLPPTFGELERRLRARGTDDEDKIAGRLERAKREYREIGRYDYVVLNDRVEHAALELSAILTAEGCRISKRTHLTEGV